MHGCHKLPPRQFGHLQHAGMRTGKRTGAHADAASAASELQGPHLHQLPEALLLPVAEGRAWRRFWLGGDVAGGSASPGLKQTAPPSIKLEWTETEWAVLGCAWLGGAAPCLLGWASPPCGAALPLLPSSSTTGCVRAPHRSPPAPPAAALTKVAEHRAAGVRAVQYVVRVHIPVAHAARVEVGQRAADAEADGQRLGQGEGRVRRPPGVAGGEAVGGVGWGRGVGQGAGALRGLVG
jgi:hypothetical protein